jgi:hypothetical protein
MYSHVLNLALTDTKTSLITGARHGYFEVIRYLTGLGISSCEDALIAASRGGHLEIVQFFLDQDPNLPTNSALIWAASRGRLSTVKLLLEHGANPLYDGVILDEPCIQNNTEMIQFLLDSGVPVSINNYRGLIWAVQYGHVEIIQLLLDRDPRGLTKINNTFIYAAGRGRTNSIQLLLDRGFNNRIVHEQALIHASHRGRVDTAQLLKDRLPLE